MQDDKRDRRVLTDLDYVRLSTWVIRDSAASAAASSLSSIETLLDEAQIVPSRSVAPDVVTMYSQVLVRHVDDGSVGKLTVCYPFDAEPRAGFISVLSPLGTSLIGLSLGALATWACPDGATRAAELEAVLFQPEASGDYVT